MVVPPLIPSSLLTPAIRSSLKLMLRVYHSTSCMAGNEKLNP